MISLSIIIPIYNEEEIIKKNFNIINNFFKNSKFNYEIIIIESGSTDKSKTICQDLVVNPNVKLFIQNKREGWGSALKVGYSKATKKFTTFISIDLPFDLSIYNIAFEKINYFEFVLSYRNKDERTIFRRFLSKSYNLLVNNVFNMKFRSINSTLKIMNTNLIRNFIFYDNGWFHDAEILLNIKRKSIKYIEIPVPVLDRKAGISKVKIYDPIILFYKVFIYKITDKI